MKRGLNEQHVIFVLFLIAIIALSSIPVTASKVNHNQIISFVKSPDNTEFSVTFKRLSAQSIVCSLVPPNAKFKEVKTIDGVNKIIYVKELHLRNYKFVCIVFEVKNAYAEDIVKLSFYIDNNLIYTPSKSYDELADPVIQLIKSDWPPKKTGFILMNFSSVWKGYPHFHVSKKTSTELPKGIYQYVIIAPSSWLSDLDEFIAMKEDQGLKVFPATLEWIKQTYEGKDLACKIREFIKDAFNKWQIRYVLLVGGHKIIPSRYTTVYLRENYSIITDFYYMALDGTWNDNNGVYARQTKFPEADWLPDLVVGRLPVDTVNELKIVIQKILRYEKDPPIGDWMNRLVIIKGEDTWYVNKFDNFPSNMNRIRLIYGENLTSAEQVVSQLNIGESIVWVWAHGCARDYWLGTGAGCFTYEHASSLSNDEKLPVIFADSCWTADFEYGDECIAVRMLKNPHGGAIAYIGYTSLALSSEDIRGWLFGTEMLIIGKGKRPPITATFKLGPAFFQGVSVYHLLEIACVYYDEALLGDPDMAIWTEKPRNLSLVVPRKVSIGSDIKIKVIDSETYQPLQGIVVRIIENNSSWIELVSNGEGEVSFKAPTTPQNLSLTIYALHRNKPTIKKFSVKVYSRIIIDKTYISDDRCDTGSTQIVGFHAKWAHNGSDVIGCNIYVNGTRYVTNQTGWITFKVFSNEVKRVRWAVSSVECGNSRIIFEQIPKDPEMIWDQVHIDLTSSRERVDISSEASLQVNAYYEYDHQPFKGKIKLNYALRQNKVGKYEYKVESLEDDIYGLTKFESNSIEVIFDRVIIILSSRFDRIQVGKNVDIAYEAYYEYDQSPFIGTISFNRELSSDQIGKTRFTVKSITDEKYGLTSFKSNEIFITFDKIHYTEPSIDALFPFSASITINLRYASDSTPVRGAKVTLGNEQFREIEPGTYSVTIFSVTPLLNSIITINAPGFEKIVINVSSILLGNIIIYVTALFSAIIFISMLKRRRSSYLTAQITESTN